MEPLDIALEFRLDNIDIDVQNFEISLLEMFAKNLEQLLAGLCTKGDASGGLSTEIADRFCSLRSYGQLPRGRENRRRLLTDGEIASAILGS